MPFKIYNDGKMVSVERSYEDLVKFFKTHHPQQKGLSLRTLKTPSKWTNEKFTKKNFTIERDDIKYVVKDKDITNATYQAFGSITKVINFVNKVVIDEHNIYQLANKIINKVKEFSADHLKNNFFKVILKSQESNGLINIYSTKFMNINALFQSIIEKLISLARQYEARFNVKNITIIRMNGIRSENTIIYGIKRNQYDSYIVAINDLIENMIIDDSSNKKLIKLSNQHIILRPNTIKNCFISACYMTIENKYQVKSITKEFIERHPIENYELENLAKHCSLYLRKKIKIYILNGELEKLEYNESNVEDEIKILIIGCHAHALINKENIKKFDKEEINNLLNYKSEDEIQEMIKEPKKQNAKYEDFKIYTYDFETCDAPKENIEESDEESEEEEDKKTTLKFETMAYALGVYDGKKYKDFYKETKNTNIINRFLNYIEKVKDDKIIMYAHNGGKFDIYLLIKAIMCRYGWVVSAFLEQNGRIMNLECYIYESKKTIAFRDSYNFIACTLNDACESFKPKTVKLEGDVNHDLINYDNCYTEEIKQYTEKYLKNDCISLHEILNIYNKEINERFEISIKNVLTNASITRNLYLNRYYTEDTPIFSLPKSIDKEIRKYYFGGRNEVMTKIGHRKKGKFYYLDFTSLYPHVMNKYQYPIGEVSEIDVIDKEFNNNWFGFVKCKFRHIKKDEIPLHAVLQDNKLLFPYCDNWQESVLSTEEIKYSINNNLGYEYQFIKLYNYEERDYIFSECVQDIYKMKLQAEKDGKESLRSIAKILINSLYGFWGMNFYEREQIEVVKIRKEKETKNKKAKTIQEVRQYKLQTLLMNQKLNDYNIIGKYDVYNKVDRIKAKCANVGLASMITSNARMYLYMLLKDIKDAGGHTYYMDTDSVVTDYNIYDNEELTKKWIGTGGSQLGELKNETGILTGYYTDFISLGNKFYALHNPNLKKKGTILKAKGLNVKSAYMNKEIDKVNKIIKYTKMDKFNGKYKVDFNDYKLMSAGYKLQCDCMNFISGVNEVIIKNKKLTKITNNKVVKSLYDKGEIKEKNMVNPLTI